MKNLIGVLIAGLACLVSCGAKRPEGVPLEGRSEVPAVREDLQGGCAQTSKARPEQAVKQIPADNETNLDSVEVKEIKKRVKFSRGILEAFPDLYQHLARPDTSGKFDLFQKITARHGTDIPNYKYKYQDKITNTDMAGLIGEILLDDGEGLTYEQKRAILEVSGGAGTPPPWSNTAIFGTGWHTPIPESALHIMKLLKDKDERIRWCAAGTLGKLGAQEAIPELARLLKDKNVKRRLSVIRILIQLDAPETVIPELLKLLKDKDKLVRMSAARILVQLNTIPEMMKLLSDEDAEVRQYAAEIFGELGIREASLEVMELLKDEYPEVREQAVKALGHLDAQASIPVIVKLLKDEDERVRCSAVAVLGYFGAQEVEPEIIKRLEDDSEDVRSMARQVLAKWGVEIPKEKKKEE